VKFTEWLFDVAMFALAMLLMWWIFR